ncbi:hypothetical protein [uncultured Tenacibaculum sp.]|uniref:hypothetical protein n=1 Tax=uncultured Tenacibaculum sp. TaxID=174713 RepID=UPI0026183352|nr:hypothetical protein [uncultured Tenacibaculum sp.]
MKNVITKTVLSLILFLLSSHISFSQDDFKSALETKDLYFTGVLQLQGERYRYDYHDVYEKDSLAKVLQESGYHGGGPSWLGIIYGAFKVGGSDLIDNLETKVEVSGITFWSTNRDDLEKIGRIVSLVKANDTALQLAIDKATELNIMQ